MQIWTRFSESINSGPFEKLILSIPAHEKGSRPGTQVGQKFDHGAGPRESDF